MTTHHTTHHHPTHNRKASMNKKVRAVLLVILAVLVVFFIVQRSMHKKEEAKYDAVPSIAGDVNNLISFSVLPGTQITGTVEATGSLRGAYFFEANAQGMLLDSNKNIVSHFQLEATSNWMTVDGVAFKATIDTSAAPKGPGFIRLHNDNPSGEAANDKFVDIPVVFN